MLAIIALILIAIVGLAILGFAVHILFSPWLLLVVVGICSGSSSVRGAPANSWVHPPLHPGQRVA